MCKIMMVPGIKPENSEAAWAWAVTAAPQLVSSDKHAFGYAALSRTTGLFGEKWTNVENAFNTFGLSKEVEATLTELSANEVNNKENYAQFGNRSADIGAIILHARHATCERNIQNAHPFVRDGLALIHNGVITNSKLLTNISSTCDSETILNEYVDYDVQNSPELIDEVTQTISGWYAVAVLGNSADGTPIMDIFKESKASLFVAWVDELGAAVYCTQPGIIYQTAKELGFNVRGLRLVPPHKLIRLNAFTAKRMNLVEFTESKTDWSAYTQPKTVTKTVSHAAGYGDEYGYNEDWRDETFWERKQTAALVIPLPKNEGYAKTTDAETDVPDEATLIEEFVRDEAKALGIPADEIRDYIDDVKESGMTVEELAAYRMDVREMFNKYGRRS